MPPSFRAPAQAERPLGVPDPASHRGIAVEVKAALMGQARIGQERDIGERDTRRRSETATSRAVLHPRQRGVSALDLVGIEFGDGLPR